MKKRGIVILLLLALVLSGCTQAAPVETTQAIAETAAPGEYFRVHFLDVGQADCALLEYDGAYILIDGGNKEDGQFVISYLENQGVQELEAVVCSHAHEDHVGGLPSVLAVYPTKAVYAPTRTYASRVYDDFLYYTDQQGLEVTMPEPGDTFFLGDVELMVLGPTQSYADPNDTSIILRVAHGENVFLFTGDMETQAENDMLDYWDNDALFQADVLKVGHHGSNTSTSYRFLNTVSPTYGVISVGTDNSYGHPHEEPMSRLNQAEVVLFRTDELGTVIANSNGTNLMFNWNNQASAPAAAQPAEPLVFIGNKNSQKFHSQDCANLPAEKNQVFFDTYAEAEAAGYSPCGSCLG